MQQFQVPPVAVRLTGMFGLLAALAGCAGPVGPVVGDWRGETPESTTQQQLVELVLDGPADAASGRYQMAITTEATIGGGAGTQRWAGPWRRGRAADGRPVFCLHDDLSGAINRYELGADLVLRPMGTGNRMDGSPVARLYALYPVAPGFGYGRV